MANYWETMGAICIKAILRIANNIPSRARISNKTLYDKTHVFNWEWNSKLRDKASGHNFHRIEGNVPWWRHQMETFSALLAICAGNSPVPGEFPAQRPVTRRFDVFFDLRPNKRLNKQWWGWWFETPSSPLWRHCNAMSSVCKGPCEVGLWLFVWWPNLRSNDKVLHPTLTYNHPVIWPMPISRQTQNVTDL